MIKRLFRPQREGDVTLTRNSEGLFVLKDGKAVILTFNQQENALMHIAPTWRGEECPLSLPGIRCNTTQT